MKEKLKIDKNLKSPIDEVFRTLRTNIQLMETNKSMKTLLITSTSSGEGKTWIASNLAVTYAKAGNKVILINADMRTERKNSIFGENQNLGLSNYLSDCSKAKQGEKIETTKYLQKTEVENLFVLSTGNITQNSLELLISDHMTNLLEELKNSYDIIIIDGTSCELVIDSVVLSRMVDSTIIVTAHGKTKQDNLNKVIKSIKDVGGNLIGVVLNKIPTSKKKI